MRLTNYFLGAYIVLYAVGVPAIAYYLGLALDSLIRQ